MRRFIAWLFRMPLVALVDIDGEVSVRLARTNALGIFYARRFGFGIHNVGLQPDGVVAGGIFVSRWVLLADYRRRSLRIARPLSASSRVTELAA